MQDPYRGEKKEDRPGAVEKAWLELGKKGNYIVRTKG